MDNVELPLGLEGALLAYVDAVADSLDPNPNRPTPEGYCASCTRAPCFYAAYDLPDPCPEYCWPGPLTESHAWINAVNMLAREHPEVGFFPGMDANEIGAMVARLYAYTLQAGS